MKINEESRVLKWSMLLASVVLTGNMLFRLADLTKILRYFPLDYTGDITSYLAQLHFLSVCGFHGYCPFWYNGFISFLMTPPGWYFFAFPLYMLTRSVTSALYLSVVAMLIISIIALFRFARSEHMPKGYAFALFMFLFGNAIAVGNFLRLGRVHAMLNWVLLVLLFLILWSFKDKEVKKSFFVVSVVYAMMLVTHYQETVLAGFLFIGLFLSRKSKKEKVIVIIACLVAVLLASWWLWGFLTNTAESSLLRFHEGKRALDFNEDRWLTNLLTYVMPLVFIGIFSFYWRLRGKLRIDLLFFAPSLVLAGVYVTKVYVLIPVLRNISQDPWILFFLLQTVVLAFKSVPGLSVNMQKVAAVVVIVVSLVSVIVNAAITPTFVTHTDIDKEMFQTLEAVKGRYLILGPRGGEVEASYSKGYYAYGSIYLNISTAEGWSPPIASIEYLSDVDQLEKGFFEMECDDLNQNLKALNVTEVVTYRSACEKFKGCGAEEVRSSKNICLYRIT